MNYYTTNELYHYGVPGMKWGVRRKPKYKSESALDKLVNTDAKYGNKRTARHQLKINKLYKKFDKASDKDIKKAIKRGMTMTVKSAAASTAIVAGTYAANKYLGNHNYTLNGVPIRFDAQKVSDVVGKAKRAKDFIGYFY